VNYTVIIYAKNRKNMLLPGMTATVDVVTVEKKNVFMISNAALNYKPSEKILKEMADELKNNSSSQGKAVGGNTGRSSDRTKNGARNSFSSRNGARNNLSSTKDKTDLSKERETLKPGRLWYFDENKKMKVLFVRTGLNNGQKTEIISDKLKTDMKFLTGSTKGKSNTSAGNNSNNNQGRMPPRMF
jgi:HlyD family secretion protein